MLRSSSEHDLRYFGCDSCYWLPSVRIRCFHSNQSVNKCRKRIRVARLTQNSVRSVCVQQIFSKMELRRRLFIFFTSQKCSHSFTIQIEPLIADGLFWRCFSYFSVSWQRYLLGSQWDTNHPVFIQNILNCVLKTNEAFTGLERHAGG